MDHDKREYPRIPTMFELLCSVGQDGGTGILADISHSGALVAQTSVRPELGKSVRLHVFLNPACPFEVIGEVVRHTNDGFAICWQPIVDPEIASIVDDLAAIVRPRPS